jgi:hypothetical protein
MPTNYKILGQTAPTANVETLHYSVPSNTSTIIKSINITNTSASADTFSIGILPNIFLPRYIYVTVTSSTTAGYSTNGITWVETTLPSSGSWYGPSYGNGVFITLRESSNNSASSTDGITWTLRTLPASSSWSTSIYGNNKFVALAGTSDSTTAASSTDGITWALRTLPVSMGWRSVEYGNSIFLATGTGPSFSLTTTAASSTDGITWTVTTMPSSRSWNYIKYGNLIFVAIAGGVSAYSTNGVTWTQTTTPTQAWSGFAYGNGLFVIVSYFGSNPIGALSTNGITWTSTTLPQTDYSDVTYGNGIFVAIPYGATGASRAAYSTNGITWTIVSMPNGKNFYKAGYGDLPNTAVNSNYIAYNSSIPGNSTVTIKNPYTLNYPSGIRVLSTNGTSTFTTFGTEIS